LIRKPRKAWHTRWAAGALVVGSTTAVLAAPFAGTALAAAPTIPATSIAIDQSSQNTSSPAGTTYNLTGTYAPSNSNAPIFYQVTAGVDSPAGPTACTMGSGTFSCPIANPNGAGTDSITVFADNDGSGTNNAGDKTASTSHTFAAAVTTPATAVTIDAATQNTNSPAGTAYDVTGTYSPSTANAQIEYTVLSGPDADGSSLTGHTCSFGGGTYDCSVANTNPGVDTIRVFADNNGDGKFTAGEPLADTNHTFSGPVFAISLTPDSPTVTANTCQAYTATATDSAGRPAAGRTLTLSAVQNSVPFANNGPSFCMPSNGTNVTDNGTTPSNLNFTNNTETETWNGTGDTNGSGQVIFGIVTDTPGTVSVTASNGGASDTSTETVTAGGANAVKTLSASPPSFNGYTGTTATYTVTAKDSSGNPLQNVNVLYELTSGPDASSSNSNSSPVACQGNPTDASGQTTCSLTNGGTAGTDDITFFVNQTSQSQQTPGLDPGEPSTTATATFSTPPAFSQANSSVTCSTPGSTATPSSTCDIPVDQKSITFTATIKDSTGAPISGAIVSWTTGGSDASKATPTNGQSTTDANGVATYTVTDSSPTAGNTITATAKVGTTAVTAAGGTATATYRTRAPAKMTLTPSLQTVTNGGTVTETVTVLDQFGTGVSGQVVTWSVGGRNAGKNGSVTTGSDGTGTITYTDTAVNPAATSDTITATDTSAGAPNSANGNPSTATVQYISGSTTASTVTVNTNTGGTSGNNSTCPSGTGTDSKTGVALSGGAPVCAHVTNNDGTALAGKSVTFTVDKGFVAASGQTPAQTIAAGKTSFTTTTDANGNAYAEVASSTSGTQTVTAQADSAKGTGTVTYNAAAPADARNISIAPKGQSITPGGHQLFTATVIDQFGNPVAGVQVTFTQSGPGTLSGGSSSVQTTDANGKASVTLNTASTDSGSGSVTATITTGSTQCGDKAGTPAGTTTDGNCADTAPYTVATPPPPPAAGSLPAYRTGSGNFFRDSLTSGAPTSSFGFGNSGDVPLFGDWNGDGTPSIGVYRPSNRTFYLSNDNKTAAIVVTIGNTGDLPVAGDFDGNGTTSIGLFRPSTGTWYITNNDHSVASSFVYGTKGDRPIVGDWTGQGVSKAGVYRPSTATFYRIGHAGIRFGNVGDTGVVGDWDANGTTTIGVVRGTTWYVSNNNSSAATSFSYGTTGARFFTWSKTAGSSAPTSS